MAAQQPKRAGPSISISAPSPCKPYKVQHRVKAGQLCITACNTHPSQSIELEINLRGGALDEVGDGPPGLKRYPRAQHLRTTLSGATIATGTNHCPWRYTARVVPSSICGAHHRQTPLRLIHMKQINLNGTWRLTYGPQQSRYDHATPPPTWPTIPAHVPGNVELDLVADGGDTRPNRWK